MGSQRVRHNWATEQNCDLLGSSVHGPPRQEYWSGLQFPSPGNLPDSGIEPSSPALAGRFFTTEPPEKPIWYHTDFRQEYWWKESRSVVSNSLWPHGLYSPWNSPGQNTGVGRHSLLQGIVPTQGSSPGLPHCRPILYQLNHQGNPRILEWVVFPPPGDLRDPGMESHLLHYRWILYLWATGEAQAGEEDDRGWDGWMASLTQWTWVWASSRSWWWTGKPGVLQSMGSQRVRHDWATELNWCAIIHLSKPIELKHQEWAVM